MGHLWVRKKTGRVDEYTRRLALCVSLFGKMMLHQSTALYAAASLTSSTGGTIAGSVALWSAMGVRTSGLRYGTPKSVGTARNVYVILAPKGAAVR